MSERDHWEIALALQLEQNVEEKLSLIECLAILFAEQGTAVLLALLFDKNQDERVRKQSAHALMTISPEFYPSYERLAHSMADEQAISWLTRAQTV